MGGIANPWGSMLVFAIMERQGLWPRHASWIRINLPMLLDRRTSEEYHTNGCQECDGKHAGPYLDTNCHVTDLIPVNFSVTICEAGMFHRGKAGGRE